jgi:hypothetical protein
VSVTSAKVGPFDLGTVVLRFGLNIDPYTARVNVTPTTSEPVLQGYGVTINLVGDTFINIAEITSSMFKTVPDQP